MRLPLVLIFAGSVAACDADAVELPRDAARPIAPPAVVSVAADPVPVPEDRDAGPPPKADLPPSSDLPPDVSRASSRYVHRNVTPRLHGRALAHRVYQARFGPSSATGDPTAVVLTRSARPGEPSRVAGFALSKGERFDFPALHEGGDEGARGPALDRVAAVMFRDVDTDPDLEVIVLIAYEDEVPEAPPFFSNVVLDWDAPAGRFVRVERLEGEIEAFSTAGEVAAHLRRISPP